MSDLLECQKDCMEAHPHCYLWYKYCATKHKDNAKDRRACYDACWVWCMELCQREGTEWEYRLADCLEDG